MNADEFIEFRLARFRVVLRSLHKSLETERTYCGHMDRFLRFGIAQADFRTTRAEELARRFVESRAENWAVATQDQFRNSLVSYYKHVLQKPLGDLGGWAHAKRPKRLPVWLPHEEMLALISHLRGIPKLMAEVGYGSGARSQELARLRWGNIDFSARTITVRGGKGEKDRVTLLAASVIEPLREHMESCKRLYFDDRKKNRPGVEVPAKFDGGNWHWFWVWPALNESRDPRTGIVRRHHLHKSTLGKAITKAVPSWGGNQRVTVHSLRHSFATTLLSNGVPIHEVQKLLGHERIETTLIYCHVLPYLTRRVRSPLDTEPSKVMPFVSSLPATPFPKAASASLAAV